MLVRVRVRVRVESACVLLGDEPAERIETHRAARAWMLKSGYHGSLFV